MKKATKSPEIKNFGLFLNRENRTRKPIERIFFFDEELKEKIETHLDIQIDKEMHDKIMWQRMDKESEAILHRRFT